MNPGRLRQAVTLQQRTAVRDDHGGRADTWAAASPALWAAVVPLEGSEATRAMQQGARRPHRITLRYRPGVTTALRVKYGARVFDIRSVVDVEERREWLELTADEVTP